MAKKILVAMSGGVDSSVTALLLQSRGVEIAGITMCLGIEYHEANSKACCDPAAIQGAKAVCNQLGIPHYTVDFSEQLKEFVIDDFISEYQYGRTPNPCVRCNQYLKFQILLKQALAMGYDGLATGHYARITEDSKGFHLECSSDHIKDQTYFLYGIRKEHLKSIHFPLSSYTKQELRKIAADFGVATANKPDSQDICFIPDGNYRHIVDSVPGSIHVGDIVTKDGQIIGQHNGIHNYTIGQRRGLGIAMGTPKYVLDIDAVNNRIVIGDYNDLQSIGLILGQFNFLEKIEDKLYKIKIRSSQKPVECRVNFKDDNLLIDFLTPVSAVTPGQSGVLYDGARVIGGGIINEVIKMRTYE